MRNYSNTWLAIIFVFCMLLLEACGGNQTTQPITSPKPLPNIYSLIFIDKTVSVSLKDNYTREKYEKALQEIVQQNVRRKGDKIEVYFLHENTSQARVFAMQCKAEMKDTAGLNPTDIKSIKNAYQVSLKKEKNKMQQRCIEALLDDNITETKQYTDIWAILPIIDKKNAKKPENTIFKVFILSDMVESMPGLERRDFYKRPPFSRQEAEQWAEKDVKRFTEIDLSEVEMYYVLPHSPLSTTNQNNPNVLHYWEKMLSKLGLEELKEWNVE
ncbi:MAG: hypothetical protein RMJ97_08425 [Raineya sp.]|nr:hypothetical protein [Raineya sp.]